MLPAEPGSDDNKARTDADQADENVNKGEDREAHKAFCFIV
jgi:hypothetical protein